MSSRLWLSMFGTMKDVLQARKTDLWKEGEAKQKQREYDREGDLTIPVRVTLAGPLGGDLMHFVPTEKQRNRDRKVYRRQTTNR